MIGIVIALIMRGAFIAVGAALIENFSWVFYLFGALLLFLAYRQAFAHGESNPADGRFMRLVRRVLPVSDEYNGDRLTVVDSLGKGDVPSTKAAASVLASVTGKNVLVVLERGDEVSYKSVRNLPSVHVLWDDQLNAYDVVNSDDIVFTKAAFDSFVDSKSPKSTSKEEVSA